MGNTFFCNRCDTQKFNLSSACADHFLNDDKEKQITSEERWMLRLRCFDDVHSKQHGITPENFDALVRKLEKRLETSAPIFCKNRDTLADCLRRNPTCALNCKRESDEFIDCVDTLRIRRIKEIIQQEKTSKINIEALFNSQ